MRLWRSSHKSGGRCEAKKAKNGALLIRCKGGMCVHALGGGRLESKCVRACDLQIEEKSVEATGGSRP